MRSVLIVADREGIGGVDSLEMLASGTGQYREAARLMSMEVGLVAGLLRQRGVERIRVVDSHRSGAPWNIDPTLLPDGQRVSRTRRQLRGLQCSTPGSASACTWPLARMGLPRIR